MFTTKDIPEVPTWEGRPSPGTWEGNIWSAPSDGVRETYRWVNYAPTGEPEEVLFEIEMYTEPGHNDWNVSFFECEAYDGDVEDGVAQQPRLDGEPINPGQGRTYYEAMRYVEKLMNKYS